MILVTGATGTIGSEVVRALLAAGQPVRALTRDPSAASFHHTVEVAAGDLDDPRSLQTALEAVTSVFLLPGYADMPGLLSSFLEAGVARVVLLSGSSAASGDESNAISRYMIRSERAVRASGIAWTIIRPSAFMSNTLRWAAQIAAGDVVKAPWAEVRVAMLDPQDIGEVAAKVLTTAGYDDETLRLTGPVALTPAEQLAVLADALGRNLRLEAQSDDDARLEMAGAMPPDYVDAFFDFYSDGALDESVLTPTVSELLGRTPRTLAQWAAAHAQAFSSKS